MPRITIVYKIFNFKCMFLTLSLFLHLLPRKYNVTQEAEAIWDRIVASAAPAMPILKTYINRVKNGVETCSEEHGQHCNFGASICT